MAEVLPPLSKCDLVFAKSVLNVVVPKVAPKALHRPKYIDIERLRAGTLLKTVRMLCGF